MDKCKYCKYFIFIELKSKTLRPINFLCAYNFAAKNDHIMASVNIELNKTRVIILKYYNFIICQYYNIIML